MNLVITHVTRSSGTGIRVVLLGESTVALRGAVRNLKILLGHNLFLVVLVPLVVVITEAANAADAQAAAEQEQNYHRGNNSSICTTTLVFFLLGATQVAVVTSTTAQRGGQVKGRGGFVLEETSDFTGEVKGIRSRSKDEQGNDTGRRKHGC